jgi:hypothetical protein
MSSPVIWLATISLIYVNLTSRLLIESDETYGKSVAQG